MKKMLMLLAVLFGTSVMVSAAPLPKKTVAVKEVKMIKHPKHKKAKVEKKATKTETSSTTVKK